MRKNIEIFKEYGKAVRYGAGEYMYREDEKAERVGIIVSGAAHVTKPDYGGNENIFLKLLPGDTFGEAAAFSSDKTMPFSVVSDGCETLIVDAEVFLSEREFLLAALNIMADKTRKLSVKMEIITKRGTREKILAFLARYSRGAEKGNSFTVPFNRGQIAAYLSVDRSALSRELSRMRGEGLIKFKKNKFVLL